MSNLSQLEPAPIWTYFGEICKIPRLSKNEGKVRAFLKDFAVTNSLDFREDSIGNIVIIRPAAPGLEDIKTVVLQSHMDMVGEKNADYNHDWNNDPVIPLVEGEFVTAQGTTLGADDGMGIAAQLAILTDKSIRTGKIECLFTVDEESGMTGAINLQPGFFEGMTLINLDSEDEGILFIGCAGGMDTVGTLEYNATKPVEGSVAIEIYLNGLHGGHSGDEIHKGYGNSVKLMNRILWNLEDKFEVSVATFRGGNLRNAIPREAVAVITAKAADKDTILNWVKEFEGTLKEEFRESEKEIRITMREVEVPPTVMDRESQGRLLNSLSCCPHGVIAWSHEMEDLVETSTNLAAVSFEEGRIVKIITTQRSSVESAKHDVAGMVRSCLDLGGAQVVHSDGYPGWRPSLKSEILGITRKSYLKLFGKEPAIRAIHAGLECGLIYEKFKGIDMISFGPSIKGAHTTEEKIEIKTVKMFWDLLIDVLKNIPSQKN
jgi:dipeptidase D